MALSSHTPRDTFFWLGQINKASLVVNADKHLLDGSVAACIARGLQTVLDDARTSGLRPSRVIDFEPVLIAAAGVEATLLHAGRSSQDMHATASSAQLREETLALAECLAMLIRGLADMAERHQGTLVPNYTNGVAAQPNSYGHYLLGHTAGFMRDGDRLRGFYTRLDLCPMGTAVLNGTGWPLDRVRMAVSLGFDGVVDNAYDAVQIRSLELPMELGHVACGIALHVGTLIQDVMVQYSQPRPWLLLKEGGDNTYVSSAMPQKRNPGLLNDTRAEASRIVTLSVGRTIQAHNVPSGMSDARSVADNTAVVAGAANLVRKLVKVLSALEIDPARALEELDLDWTASQELADLLMLDHGVPFRVGHHFASDMVSFARKQGIRPSSFSHEDATRLYSEACVALRYPSAAFPLSESQFRSALDPAAIVGARKTSGGPQASEMQRMVRESRSAADRLGGWTQGKRRRIDDALEALDADFGAMVGRGAS
ncbi:hypothetical protein ANO11243_034800 [Dothideomycetidae sp. 11243]|nr:hypothetical protein ANO11243_034800 [fungal sp. No.11243]